MYLLERFERDNKVCNIIQYVAERMVAQVGDARAEDKDGRTLLMYACASGCTYVVKKIIGKLDQNKYEDYSYINAVDMEGCTALGMAFSKGHKDVAEYLIKEGIMNPGTIENKDDFGKLVKDVNSRRNQQEIIRIGGREGIAM